MTTLEKISSVNGSRLVTGTTAVSRNFASFTPNEAAVIAELYYSSDTTFATNLVTTLGLSGATLAVGIPFFCKAGESFGKIKLTSGSVIID